MLMLVTHGRNTFCSFIDVDIGFLMMECEEAGPKVMTFLQERPVQLPKCEDLACDWKTFKDIYAVRK